MNFIVESERLLLRPFRSVDAEAYHKMTEDDEIRKYVEYACAPTLEETIENIELSYSQGDFVHDYYLILEEKQTHKIIGAILATQGRSHNMLETCILTHRNYRNKGYMSEALNAFVSALPQKTVLIFAIKKENKASLQTVKKIYGIKEVPRRFPDSICRIFYYMV